MNMPAGQNHSNCDLNKRVSAPRYDTWYKIQVLITVLLDSHEVKVLHVNKIPALPYRR